MLFGIGCDVAHVPRVERLVRRFGDRFLARAFHPLERERYRALAGGRGPAAAAEFLASRWAVKEATQKAFSSWRLQFPCIRVDTASAEGPAEDVPALAARGCGLVRMRRPRPRLVLEGPVAALALELALGATHVSISHDGAYAMATVVLERSSRSPAA